MAIWRKLVAGVLALVMLSPLSSFALAETDSSGGSGSSSGEQASYVRFKNQWQGTYLYEDAEGKVRYGFTAPENAASQWLIEEAGDGLTTIRNKASGHYLNMASVVPSDKITQPIESTDIAEGLPTALWKVQEAEPGYVNVVSSTYASRLLNIQTLDGYAHANDWAQPGWGSAKWQLETAYEEAPVRIADQWQGHYLYEDEGVVKYGDPEMNDLSSQWYVRDGVDGTVRLQNRATGHFMNAANVIASEDVTIPLESTVLSGGDAVDWEMNASVAAGVYGFSLAGYPNYVLNVQTQDGYAHGNDWAQPDWASAQWKLEPAADTLPVRLKDGWQGQYLYEENGAVAYGTPEAADKSSEWLVENTTSGVTLRNLGSGGYAFSEPSGTDAASVGEAVYSSTEWIMDAAQNDAGGSVGGYYTFSLQSGDGLLNVQAQDGYAHANDWAQTTWGSAQWKLEDPSESDPGEEAPSYIRIRNYWLQLYLYEDNGVVKYGNAAADDPAGQWLLVEEEGGVTRIQNRATGHYVTLDGVDGARAAVRADDLAEDSTDGDWVVIDYQGYKLIRSAEDRSDDESTQSYLNVENKLKALQYGVISRDWGSPKWEFLSADEDAASYVRLKNSYRGTYLYEEDGIVKDGQPDAADPASHWLLKQGRQGTLIVNRATGHLITNEHVGSYEDPLEALDLDPTWGSVQWTVEAVAGSANKVFRNVWKTDSVIHDEDNKGFAQASSIPADWGSAQWVLEAAPELPVELPEGYMRIQNKLNGQYLYENGRQVVLYGMPEESDSSSHWSFVREEGGTLRIVNRATGRSISIENGRAYLETSGDSLASPDLALWQLEEAGEAGYYSIRSEAEGHEDEYVHLEDGLGFAQYELRSVESDAVQWKLEAAPETAVAPSGEAEDANGATPVLAEMTDVRIVNESTGQLLAMKNRSVTYEQASSASPNSLWTVESYNGHKRLKNQGTGFYLSAAASGGGLDGTSAGGALAAQWDTADVLGYKTIRSVSKADSLLAQSAAGAAAKLAQASSSSASSRWSFLPVSGTVAYPASDAFASGGVVVSGGDDNGNGADSNSSDDDDGLASGFSEEGARLLWSVNADEARTYSAAMAYRNDAESDAKLGLYVNGLKTQTVTWAPTAAEGSGEVSAALDLRAGSNTVELRYEDAGGAGVEIGALRLADAVRGASRGATVPYAAYELEDAATTGSLIGPGRDYGTFAAESSGRAAVRLDEEGQYVEFKAAKAANALTLRYILPDSEDGTGQDATLSLYVNGQKTKTLELSSEHSWVYGKYPYSNHPADGDAHRFYDETHALVGDIPAGATVRLQRDAGDDADYYVLDLLELENAPAAYGKPEGYRSVTEFGAAADDGSDDGEAFREAIAAAQAEGFGVWVPEGRFELSGGPLEVKDVTIRGAGMWHTELHGEGFMGIGSNVAVYDLLLDVGVTGRHDSEPEAGFDGAFGTGSTIQNVWIEHAKAGIWTTLSDDLTLNTDGLYVGGVRVRNTYADGIHLSTGTRNTVVEQSVLRNTGDDSIALWSDPREGATAEQSRTQSNRIRFNTVQLPYLADNVAVFGGQDNQVTDNILADTMGYGAGIAISTRFDPVPFSGTTLVERNTLLRTGGHEASWKQDFGAIWLFVENVPMDADILIQDNEAIDSTFQGLYISGPNSINASGERPVVIRNYVIDGAGTWGINVSNGVSGSVKLDNVLIRKAKVGRLFNAMGDSFTLNVTTQPPVDEEDDGGGSGTGNGSAGNTGSEPSTGIQKRAAEGDKQLSEALASGSDRIEASGSEGSSNTSIVFSAAALREAAKTHPSAMLSLSFRGASFELTLSQAAALLGNAADDAYLELSIDSLEASSADALDKAAKREGLELIPNGAYHFGTTLHSNGTASELTVFGRLFVDRQLIVDKEVDADQATVLLFDPATGTLRYVPALFETTEDGGAIVTIRSASNGLFVLAASDRDFSDTRGHWAQNDLRLLANKRIANGEGDGGFSPNRAMTRAEFAALLVRSLGLSGTGASTGFNDVSKGAWYATEVNAAAEFGLVQGDEDGGFRPTDEITREQMAVLLARAMELIGQSLSGAASSEAGASASGPNQVEDFADAGRVSPWAADALNRLLAEGILSGTSASQLSPQGAATRAEGAVLLERMLQALNLL